MTELSGLDLDPNRDPWDRQPKETNHRYGQFVVYRDLGRARLVRQAAENLRVRPDYLRHVAASMLWSARAEAWDAHRDEQFDKMWLEERRRAAADDARILDGILSKIVARLRTLKPELLTPADVARLVDVAMRHRRVLYGDGPEIAIDSGLKIRYEVVGVPDLSALH